MKKILLFTLILFISNACSSQTQQENTEIVTNNKKYNFPKPIGYVNDYASILNNAEIRILEEKLEKFEERTTNEIAIITLDLDELTEENFDEYTLELSRFWGVGKEGKNNGLTIVLSPKLRKLRINTGLGTEKILTDKICKNVLHTVIVPEFKKDNFFEGLEKGVDELIRLWK